MNKWSCLAPALGVTKFTTEGDIIWFTLCCATSNPPLVSRQDACIRNDYTGDKICPYTVYGVECRNDERREYMLIKLPGLFYGI